MKPEKVKATFVTFYSFKGGVGRSMALINPAGILAGRRGFRVLVLDLDLEAPGLSYLDPESPDTAPAQAQRELPLQPGFVDLLTDAKERGGEADLFKLSGTDLETKYTRKIKIPDALREFPDGSLRIMPAGLFDHDYARRLDALNLNALYRGGLGEPLIRAFKTRLADSGSYHYVLVDSRTGISEGAGICTRDLADHVMLLSGLNRQNVEGTSEFLREFRVATDAKKQFQIILSPMPNGEDDLLDRRRQIAEQRFGEAWGEKVVVSLEIPYHPQLALTEEPHIFRRRRGYLFDAYATIEARMLDGLGHDAQVFRQRVMEALEGKQYEAALCDLDHMIRLNHGQSALARLADELVNRRRSRRRVDTDAPQEPVTFKKLLGEEGGRSVVRFVIENFSPGERDWLNRQLVKELGRSFPGLAESLLTRIAAAAANDAEKLGDYAVSFEREDLPDAAQMFYKQAVEIGPKHARNLWNYGDFLAKQRKDMDAAKAYYMQAIEADPRDTRRLRGLAAFLERRGELDEAEAIFRRALETNPKDNDIFVECALYLERRGDMVGAEAIFKRAIEASPNHSGSIGAYALFLERLGNAEEAESCFKRAIETDPKSAWNLANYADFLDTRKGDLDGAEAYYERAVQAAPQDASALGNYALFLDHQRDDAHRSEIYYRRALEAEPQGANNLGNFGQLLVGVGRFQEAQSMLVQALQLLDPAERGDAAEVCYSLWLLSRLQGRDGKEWEGRFKSLIEQGFKRYDWSFERMLKLAEKSLPRAEFEYAKGLAAAFLDESKVTELAKDPRWQALQSTEGDSSPAGGAS
jgi:Tfp pilus assembly protein PilF